MPRKSTISTSLLLFLGLGACIVDDKQIGDDEAAEAETGDGDGDPMTGDGDGDGDANPETGDGDDDPCTPDSPDEDPDCDGLALSCDNARDDYNPDQLDQDRDGWGDVFDTCPLIDASITADTDKDGLGNACDRCKDLPASYVDTQAIADPKLWVRNVPTNVDFDQDGVGDACDNCVVLANCGPYGPDNPAPHDAEAEDSAACQDDADSDGIGDACIDPETLLPISGPSAAGPVGFAATDDFDQDGLNNFEDACPRLPLGTVDVRLACTDDIDCNMGAGIVLRCAETAANDGVRYCNHRDTDNDSVGDACDTCAFNPNAEQVTDTGMQTDDADADFIGAACEIDSSCGDISDARHIGFYDVSVGGQCCVTTYPGDDVLHDPDGAPIRIACSTDEQDAGICRRMPSSLAALPGVVELPPGCEGALELAGVATATALTLADVGGDPLAYYAKACLLPASDQDFDGIGDACDRCEFAFDPFNEPFADEPSIGAACAGEYASTPGAMCELE